MPEIFATNNRIHFLSLLLNPDIHNGQGCVLTYRICGLYSAALKIVKFHIHFDTTLLTWTRLERKKEVKDEKDAAKHSLRLLRRAPVKQLPHALLSTKSSINLFNCKFSVSFGNRQLQ
jgi:hypothetical protein